MTHGTWNPNSRDHEPHALDELVERVAPQPKRTQTKQETATEVANRLKQLQASGPIGHWLDQQY